jgi:histidine ammonia-lyase
MSITRCRAHGIENRVGLRSGQPEGALPQGYHLPNRKSPQGGILTEVVVDGRSLTLDDVVSVSRHAARVSLDSICLPGLQASRAIVERALAEGSPSYGINTGFGQLVDVAIPPEDVRQLQVNLVRSHAVGVGPPLREDEVRAMMLLRANSLARGNSGVRPELIETLLALLNAGVHPVIPSQGSVGSSGDLAPLAHMALAVIGEGHANQGPRRMSGRDALSAAGLVPLHLEAKEGLALINGTQMMTGLGVLALHDALTLVNAAEVAAAISIDSLLGTAAAFHPAIQDARGQPGQIASAEHMRRLLESSEIASAHRDSTHKVQDAYTLRCVPQVIGAIRDALVYVRSAVEYELNAVTDNPLVFPEDDLIVSGGNFHGQPVALALDVLALAVTQLAAFSERRIFRLLSPQESDLPAFLTGRPGLSSGLMIAQYTAAALVSENKVLAHPASADSIPTSAGVEDFNSMGAAAATKARRVVDNAAHVIAIELICAAQALEFRRPLRSSPAVEEAHELVRKVVPTLDDDRPLSGGIASLAERLIAGMLDGL